MSIKIAINGCGRIGRSFIRQAAEREEVEVVAVNDLADIEQAAYLLNYDTAYGRKAEPVSVAENGTELLEGDRRIKYLQEKEPENLPWEELGVDVAIEATGVFTTFEDAGRHIAAGAKRAVISAPAKDKPSNPTQKTILMGVNEEELKDCSVTSNASCTTNAGSPVISVLHNKIGIEKAVLSTTHAYTASQSVVDEGNSKKPRMGRAAALNIIPTTTGAAKATTKVITELEERFDGIALRVPVPAGSVADITFIASRETTEEEVNSLLLEASYEERWKNILAVTEEPVVSSDIIGSRYGSVADLSFTKVVGGNLVKVLAWYDNESGYTGTLMEHVIKLGQYIEK